ncbi:helix-turn-helix domain-containing protein [Actinomadura sp. HBU206391]|uniref:helix-turn-helix domain-containing protein n=1 Tax=Actinomadura sp. HBU206391 TaxID=2731692 RepID=UPI00164EFC68|nr:helix-turn-helix domain-containing protein [Actinomadura sp. HBU206391]MBC6456354.1 helix-turn-helix domain-containing protein [Actinomadura sp. HBU206391]
MSPRARLFTADEVSDALQISKRSLQKMCAERRIPFVMISGSYRVSDTHVEAIIATFEVQPGPVERKAAPRRRTAQPPAAPESGVTHLRARRPRRTAASA